MTGLEEVQQATNQKGIVISKASNVTYSKITAIIYITLITMSLITSIYMSATGKSVNIANQISQYLLDIIMTNCACTLGVTA